MFHLLVGKEWQKGCAAQTQHCLLNAWLEIPEDEARGVAEGAQGRTQLGVASGVSAESQQVAMMVADILSENAAQCASSRLCLTYICLTCV